MSMFLSAITILELETGILLIERRDPTQEAMLRTWLDGHVLPAFSGRILAVDIAVAQQCAKLHEPEIRRLLNEWLPQLSADWWARHVLGG